MREIFMAVPSPSPTGPSVGEQAGTSPVYWLVAAVVLLLVFGWLRLKSGPPGRSGKDW